MIRLNISVSRKDTRDYQSHGATVGIETEIGDPATIDHEITTALNLCRRHVDTFLAGPATAPAPAPAPPPPQRNGCAGRTNGAHAPSWNGHGYPRREGGSRRDSPPRNARELLGWSRQHTKDTCGFDLFGSILAWGKDEGLGTRVTDWSEAAVARVYAAALDWLETPAS